MHVSDDVLVVECDGIANSESYLVADILRPPFAPALSGNCIRMDIIQGSGEIRMDARPTFYVTTVEAEHDVPKMLWTQTTPLGHVWNTLFIDVEDIEAETVYITVTITDTPHARHALTAVVDNIELLAGNCAEHQGLS